MDESILISIKKLLGISTDCTDFDTDIIIHINTVFMILNQLGIGTEKCFFIKDTNSKWSDFIQREEGLEPIKTYIYLKVRMIFDPPLGSAISNAMASNIKELEWRLCSIKDFIK